MPRAAGSGWGIDFDLDEVERVDAGFLFVEPELDLGFPLSEEDLSSDLFDLVLRLSVGMFGFKPFREEQAHT